jgi:hypothetical protein
MKKTNENHLHLDTYISRGYKYTKTTKKGRSVTEYVGKATKKELWLNWLKNLFLGKKGQNSFLFVIILTLLLALYLLFAPRSYITEVLR